MNKEKYNQIIKEAYEKYWNSVETSECDGFGSTSIKLPILSKEQFIRKIKTDSEFSEKWGLKIEERELTFKERELILLETDDWLRTSTTQEVKLVLKESNIPTRLITATYNNQTIETYE